MDTDFVSSGGVQEDVSWRTHAQALSRCATLRSSYFFRVAGVTSADTEQFLMPTGESSGRLRYQLKPGIQYTLELDAYQTTANPAPADAIETLVTSDRLVAENPVTSSIGLASDVLVSITPGLVNRTTTTTLVLRGAKDVGSRAPRVELSFDVVPKTTLAVVLILLVGVGVVMAGVSHTDLDIATGWIWLIKLGGGVLVSVALLLAGRNAFKVEK